MHIETPRLTSTLPGRLTDCLDDFKNLRTFVITNPIAIESLPSLPALCCLKLHYLPEYNEDWEWLPSMKGLREIDISFLERRYNTPSSHHGERIHVSEGKAESHKMSTRGTMQVWMKLPNHMRSKVRDYFPCSLILKFVF